MIRAFLTMSLLALASCTASLATAADPPQMPAVLDILGHRASADGAVLLKADGTAIDGANPLPVAVAAGTQGAGANGAAATGNPLLVAGSDGTNARTLSTSAAGALNTIGGCMYNSAFPTLTSGTRGDTQCDSRGGLFTILKGSSGTTTAAVSAVSADGQAPVNGLYVNSAGLLFNGTTFDRARGDTTGAYVVSKGGPSLATGQVSVGTSSTLVAAARAGRAKITMSVGAANTCAFGNTGVTTMTGFPLQPTAGVSVTLDTAAALYAACSATTTISYIEQY